MAGDLALIRRLWPFVGPHRRLLAGWAVFMPLAIALELAQPVLFVHALTAHVFTGDTAGLPIEIAAYLGLVVAQGAAAFCDTWFLQLAGQRTMSALRVAIFDHVVAQRAAFFDQVPVGRLMTRMTNDIDSLNELFAQGVVALIADVIKMVAIIAIMVAIDPVLAVIAFATVPLLIILVEYARRLMRTSFRQIRARIAALNAFAQEHLSGIKVVQMLGRGAIAQREYDQINAGHRDAYLGQTRAESAIQAIVEAVGTMSIGLVIWFAAGHRVDDVAMIGVVWVFIDYTTRLFGPVRELSQKYAVMQGAMAAGERIFELLDTDQRDGGAVGARAAAVVARAEDLAIELAAVHFSYGAEPVLRGVDLCVPRGATVAVVGATGSGKSTVIKLLTRLYEHDRGEIRLDGVDIRDLPLPELRRRIVVVSQDVVLFGGTLADNLVLGRACDARAVDEAVRRVGLDRALARRGSVLDTPVAARGANFSAGERQLVAFARALLRDPEILILDEATAHVDPEAEQLIERGLDELRRGRTTLVIAHRLSTIRNADAIAVMERGRVIEHGTPAELLRRDGGYAALARAFQR